MADGGSCSCVLRIGPTVAGTDPLSCQATVEISANFGETMTLRQLYDKITLVACTGKATVGLLYGTALDRPLLATVSNETCQAMKNIVDVIDAYTYSINCAVTAAPATGSGAQGGAVTPGVDVAPCDFNPDQKCLKLENPLQSDTTDITKILGWIIRGLLGIVGSLTLLMMVWGGFQWFTAAGNPERIKKGTQTMVWAAIGVAVVFASYFIVINFTSYLTTGKPAEISGGR